MWGRLIFIAEQLCKFGNTPTCVGKTGIEKVAELGNEKHPHMRGEDLRRASWTTTLKETPPHAWGRLADMARKLNIKGNTPTCVGKTCPTGAFNSVRWKHPHMRGEDRGRQCPRTGTGETPPRAWGRLESSLDGEILRGNTPTCVGKTLSHL